MTDVAGKQLSGWTEGIALNAEGRSQVAQLGRQLAGTKLAGVYASPLERTVQTATAIAAPQGLAVETSAGIGEVHYGEWTGRWIEGDVEQDPRWHRWNAHRAEARCPGGESMLEIQSRVVAELLAIAARHPDGTVAVVSHGDPIRAGLAYFLGTPLDMVLRIEIDPASLSVVRLEEWGVQVAGVNAGLVGTKE